MKLHIGMILLGLAPSMSAMTTAAKAEPIKPSGPADLENILDLNTSTCGEYCLSRFFYQTAYSAVNLAKSRKQQELTPYQHDEAKTQRLYEEMVQHAEQHYQG